MRFFWQIAGEIATCTIRKKEAAKTRIKGSKGHYMGLNFSLFWQTGAFKRSDFRGSQSGGFTGVFPGSDQGGMTGMPALRGFQPLIVHSRKSLHKEVLL